MKSIYLINVFIIIVCSNIKSQNALTLENDRIQCYSFNNGSELMDLDSSIFLKINDSNLLVDIYGNTLSRVNNMTGVVLNSIDEFQFKINGETIYDIDGNIIGTITEEGLLYDSNYHLVAKAPMTNKYLATYFFLIFNNI